MLSSNSGSKLSVDVRRLMSRADTASVAKKIKVGLYLFGLISSNYLIPNARFRGRTDSECSVMVAWTSGI